MQSTAFGVLAFVVCVLSRKGLRRAFTGCPHADRAYYG
jgi:hypothetical protein